MIFGEEYLLKRPLLKAISNDKPMILLIDEIDRADEEFEAFLLELLSDFQISIPELGTITAKHKPIVILTSNRTRELGDALKRRCLYHWVDYPSAEKEMQIECILSRQGPGCGAAVPAPSYPPTLRTMLNFFSANHKRAENEVWGRPTRAQHTKVDRPITLKCTGRSLWLLPSRPVVQSLIRDTSAAARMPIFHRIRLLFSKIPAAST